MITISNIVQAAGTTPSGITQGAANTAAPQGLIDFLNLILGNAAAPQAALPATAAPQDLSAKISDLLKNNPQLKNNGIVQALLQMLQPAQGQAPDLPTGVSADDLLKKITELLQAATPKTADIKPSTLTSDLTASAAPVIQTAPPSADDIRAKLEALLAQTGNAPPDQKVAELLASLEPQAAQAPDASIPTDTATPPAPAVKLDPQVFRQLQDKLMALVSGEDTPDQAALAQFKEDLIRFLKDKGLDAETIPQYITALGQTLATAPVAVQAAIADDAAPAPQPAAKSAQPRQGAQAAAQQPQDAPAQKLPASDAPSAKPKAEADASRQPQQQAQQLPPQQPAPQPKAQGAASHMALINAIASGDADFGANAGTQDQSFAQLLGQNANGAAGLLKPSDGLNTQNFANYLSAGNSQSPTTQMVSVQLQANALQRVDMMTLQLNPADLGRLDIKMKFEKDGTIKAHLTADKPETLALLQRDSSHLQRALQSAGFDIDDSTISFDLRDQGQQNLGHAQDDAAQRNGYKNGADGGTGGGMMQANIAVQAYGVISQGRVNIMVSG